MTNILTNQERDIVIKCVTQVIEDSKDTSITGDIGKAYLTDLVKKLASNNAIKVTIEATDEATDTLKSVNESVSSPVEDISFYNVTYSNQITAIIEWNEKYKLGFTDKQIDKAIDEAYELPESDDDSNLTTWVLVPYLKDLKTTIDTLWEIITTNHDKSWKWDELDKAEYKLYKGKFPKKSLKWVKLDLGTYHELKNVQSVKEVRKQADEKGETLAGVEVLAAAAHFPKWFEAQDGDKVPYTDVANISVGNIGKSEPHALCVYWSPFGRWAEFDAHWVGRRTNWWAAPTIIEELNP